MKRSLSLLALLLLLAACNRAQTEATPPATDTPASTSASRTTRTLRCPVAGKSSDLAIRAITSALEEIGGSLRE